MQRTLRVQLLEGEQTLADLTFPTTLDLPRLLQGIQEMLRDQTEVIPGTLSDRDAAALKTVGKKYLGLAEHLARTSENSVTLSFLEIEQLLGSPLPATARGPHARSWWANTDTHSQGKAWLAVGWRTHLVQPDHETVEFRRK